MARRILIWLSFAAALVFYLGETNGQGASLIAVKGSAVGLLAGAALWPPREKGSSWFAAILVCGAAGDVAIEFSVIAGAACFLAGHFLAVAFYWRNRRQSSGGAGLVLAVLLVLLVPLVANLMPDNRTIAPLASLYALGLAAMAASAWNSRFSRANVGLGALLFVASDLLIFARLGPLAESPLPGLAIWPLYYAGQLLIYRGVIAIAQAGKECYYICMNSKSKLIKVGNSTGMVIPKDVLVRLRAAQGDELHFVEKANGEFTIGKYDPAFARAMELAEEIMHEDRDILRVLAK